VNTIKQNFNDLWNNEKPEFYFIVVRLAIGFLFFISLVIPYAKGSDLINGRVSLSILPGGGLFVFLIIVTILLNAFLTLLKKEKLNKITYLVQAIIATIVVLYGILMYVVGLQDVTTNVSHGLGYTLGLFMLILMWALYIKTSFFFDLFKKLVFKSKPEPEQHQEQQEQTVQE